MNRSPLTAWVLTISSLSVWLCTPPIAAQVIPDSTLPVGERSQVSGNAIVRIDGGARRGGNLFHSFSQFSISTGGSAYFNNAADVRNIFSRVTGGSISNIDGLIRANGTANLFLLNPNGILFGPNASLNLGGSFTATTANAIGFPNGEVFSSDATQPLPSQLLTVNPNAFFFNQLTPQPIINRSTANGTGLQVPLRQNLLLIGGSVQLEGGKLISPGSYVELAGVGDIGTAVLSTASEDWQLTIPDGVTRANVLLGNESDINVRGAGGSIRVLAQNIDLSDSQLRIEIPSDSRLPATQTGDLELNATGSITISNSTLANSLFGQGRMGSLILTAGDRITINGSSLFSTAEPNGLGAIGAVTITARTILFGNTLFVANTSQQTDASDVFINARDAVSFNGSTVFNTVESTGIGNGGDINITTGSLVLTGGTQFLLFTRGQGNAGNVNIDARDTVLLDGSSILNTVESTGIGNGGNINITTGSLALANNAQLIFDTSGRGNAGNVNINARDSVSLDGSDIFNTVESTGIGNGGDLNIRTGSLALVNNAQLIFDTSGRGNAGNVNINARDIVSLDGSTIFNTVESTGIGNGGDLNITTGSLALTNGVQLIFDTSGRGNVGNVNIDARDRISFDRGSYVFKTVNQTGIGNSGDIDITTGSLAFTNGAGLVGATYGQGNVGNINILARDTVALDGGTTNTSGTASVISSAVGIGGVGNGGSINIQAQQLTLKSNAALIGDVFQSGRGKGGDINLNISGTILLLGGTSAESGESAIITSRVLAGGIGNGGDLRLRSGTLVLQNGGLINASTQGQGDAGNIDIRADRVAISGSIPSSGLPSGLFTSSDTAGNAGDITIQTQTFQISDGAALSARSRGNGQGGDITVNTTGAFEALNGGQLITTTFGQGQAGNIIINAGEQITIAGSDPNYIDRLAKFPNPINPNTSNAITEVGSASGLFANTEPNSTGRGGNIQIATRTFNIQNQAEVTVSSAGTGSAGNLFVDADRIYLSNQGSIRADTTGGGGNINVRSPFILLRNGSNITTNATGANIPGGNITIDTQFLIAVPNEDSNISANSENFRGGNVRINAFSIFGIQPRPDATPLSDITATGETAALSGTIDVITSGLDPTSGLVALPTDFADSSGLIAQGCPADQGNSFVITGRGGLPPTPEQQLDDDAEWSDRRRLVVAQQTNHSGLKTFAHSPSPIPYLPMIEATGWQVTPAGAIVLVATTPSPTVQNPLNQPIVCPGR